MSPTQYNERYEPEKLKNLRVSKGLSFGRLRDEILLLTHGKYRLHPQTLEKYEKPRDEGGRSLPYEKAIVLSEYFGVGLDAFCRDISL